MTRTPALLLWTSRILAIGMCLFLGMFALDAFSGTTSLRKSFGDFAIHLVPALLVLAVVVLAWRREWIGAAAFLTLGVGYALIAQRLDWILAISGPLWLIGLLFLASWRTKQLLTSNS